MTNIYKTINQINPAYIWDCFVEKHMPYNLRSGGVTPPRAQFLSAQDQIWHFCRQISKLVIYVGKMQKFSYLSAKSYAPVILNLQIEDILTKAPMSFGGPTSLHARDLYNSRPMLLGILVTVCNVWATVALLQLRSISHLYNEGRN